MSTTAPLLWFDDIDTDDISIGKHAKKLAELTQAKFPIMPGFLITSKAYSDFLKENMLDHKIQQLLSTVSFEHADSLMQGEFHIKKLFDEATVSEEFADELLDFYEQLGDEVTLSVHETGPHEKKHATNQIDALDDLLDAIINLWAEMFTGNALYHRSGHHLDHLQTPAEIIVQKKIHSETTGTIRNEKNTLVIVTKHPHENDEYILSKKNLTILDRSLKHTSHLPKLSEKEILAIAKMAKRLENHLFFPQEISWIIADNKIYIAEIKPVTSLPQQFSETKRKLPIARGKCLTPLIGTGVIHIINSDAELNTIKEHDIVIMTQASQSHLKQLKKARGVIISSHPHPALSIILRQHGIPAMINVTSIKNLRNGQVVTLHADKGEIYLGGYV